MKKLIKTRAQAQVKRTPLAKTERSAKAKGKKVHQHQKGKDANKLFSPLKIVTTLEGKLNLDLIQHQHVYKLNGLPLRHYLETQKLGLLKKFFYEETGSNARESLEQDAFEKFRSINERMWLFNATLSDLPDRTNRKSPQNYRVLNYAKGVISAILGRTSMDELFEACRHSGGTTIGVKYSDTSLEAKMKYPLSSTERAAKLFNQYLAYDPHCKQALLLSNAGETLSKRYEIVLGSRATTVEKTASVRRMIAIEPTCNMFLQQGMMELMYKRMAAAGLSVDKSQVHHKVMAKYASISRSHGTIDFASASDCVSYELVRYLLPPSWFWYFDMVRSPQMSLTGTWEDLAMASTMGNAVTFPLETLVFYSLACAVAFIQDNPSSNSMGRIDPLILPTWDTTVYGDDCIVPSHRAALFIEVATRVGFMVNEEKSFYRPEDPFRESCGGDYLSGQDVRPMYFYGPTSNRSSALEPWLYVLWNKWLKKSILLFGQLSYIYVSETNEEFVRLFRKHKLELKFVPDDMPDDAGLKLGEDLKRFMFTYKCDFSPLKVGVHGTVVFRFCRWTYDKSIIRSESVQYWNALHRRAQSDRFSSLFRQERRHGGYVAGKGKTCFWDLTAL